MYFDGLSYRRVAEVWRADEVVKEMKVDTGPEWVADEIAVKVGGKQYCLATPAHFLPCLGK